MRSKCLYKVTPRLGCPGSKICVFHYITNCLLILGFQIKNTNIPASGTQNLKIARERSGWLVWFGVNDNHIFVGLSLGLTTQKWRTLQIQRSYKSRASFMQEQKDNWHLSLLAVFQMLYWTLIT